MRDPQKVWLQKLRQLNPNVSHAKGTGAARFAPHKPLLLLAILDLASAGILTHWGRHGTRAGLLRRAGSSFAIARIPWGSAGATAKQLDRRS